MNASTLWGYLRSLSPAIRVILFEKCSVVAALAWWGGLLVCAPLLYLLYPAAALAVLLAGAVLHGRATAFLMGKKHLLIRPGDHVEYALPDAPDPLKPFVVGRVLYPMRRKDVAKTALFDPEHLDLYSRFYLVDIGRQNTIIPYEWIVSLEIAELPL